MSNGGRGSGIGDRDARLYDAVDGAVREMLDVEPPPGLRGRVLDRIEAGGPAAPVWRRKALWLMVPVAAAAVMVLAVFGPWRRAIEPAPSAPPAIASAADQVPNPVLQPPPTRSTAPTSVEIGLPYGLPHSTGARRAPSPARPGLVVAAAALTDTDTVVTQIEPLPGPPSIAIERLASPAPAMSGLGVAPLEIRALEVTALTETPRERREE
jgi:hypothetical protein